MHKATEALDIKAEPPITGNTMDVVTRLTELSIQLEGLLGSYQALLIKNTKATENSVAYMRETDPSGYIQQHFLESNIEQGLRHIAQLTGSLTDEANSIMNQVADIVSLPHLDDSEVQYGVRDTTIKRDDTVIQLYEFNANHSIDPPNYVQWMEGNVLL